MYHTIAANQSATKKASTRSVSNQRTLDAYNKHVSEYVDKTPLEVGMHQPEMREWIDQALRNIQPDSSIFEIGSAILRDASYMRQKGFTVTCSDATDGFVKMLRSQGENAISFNVLEDNFPEGSSYAMVFANGVFPHFTPDELHFVVSKIYDFLPVDGVLAFSTKYGAGDEWIKEKFDEERFTHYWKLEDLFHILHKVGYKTIFENNNVGSFPSHRWVNIVAQK